MLGVPGAPVVRGMLVALAVASAAACSASGGKAERRDGGAAARDAGPGGAAAGDAALGDGALGAAVGDAAAGGAQVGESAAAPPSAEALAAAAAFGYQLDEAAARAGGRLRVIVRWPDTPLARRASPGDNECGKPRLPSASPDELWGVADVLVALELPRGKAPVAAPLTVTAEACALSPRLAVARPGAALILASRDAALHAVRLRAHPLDELRGLAPRAGSPARTARLPWRGHRAEVALAGAQLIQLELDGKHAAEDAAWVAVVPHPYAAITDRAGGALFSDVPAGETRVTAWLPPRAGAKALELHGEATVVAGQTTELVLTPTSSSSTPPAKATTPSSAAAPAPAVDEEAEEE